MIKSPLTYNLKKQGKLISAIFRNKSKNNLEKMIKTNLNLAKNNRLQTSYKAMYTKCEGEK